MTTVTERSLDTQCINTIRTLAVDMVQKANSGHPGAPMGCAAMAYTLWTRHLRFNPKDPKWPDRDRFILSNGHASALIYSLLHLTGFDLSMDDLKNFRQRGSKTPGHPENFMTPGIEMTTGPLGQGLSSGVGFAIAETHLAARFNRPEHEVMEHFTYVIAGDGDLMEGVTSEAASLAGHLGLGKLIALYDDNHITIDGDTSLAFTEDVEARFQAYGWQTIRVTDGNDVEAIDIALKSAKTDTARPTLILVRTHIGFGSPNKQDTSASHGSPLGDAEIRLTKAALDWPEEAKFLVPEDVSAHMIAAGTRGAKLQQMWNDCLNSYTTAHPKAAAELTRRLAGKLPEGWENTLPTFPASEKGIASRAASGKILDALTKALPEMMGGSADLAGSVKIPIGGHMGNFSRENPEGRNIFFGVREHAMGSICNGMALHGGFTPYGATFFVFSDYMRPAVRLGALSEAASIWIWTHDSVGLGEDGPTHQPVEHLAALRAIPDFVLLRPADANETLEAWKIAITEKRPVGLVLTRQNLPTVDRTTHASAKGVWKGGYTLIDSEGGDPEVVLIGTGSEVTLALGAHKILSAEGIRTRVVSIPSWRLFEDQGADYIDAVLPESAKAFVAVEAGCSMGWAKYIGRRGHMVGLDRFGASMPYPQIYEVLGLTVEAVVNAARKQLRVG